MAYIDDNNDLTAGKGKDPIKELDDELDKLLAELKEMEASDQAPDDTSDDVSSEKAEDAPTPDEIAEKNDADNPDDEENDDEDHPAKSKKARSSKPPKKKSKAPVIIAVIVLVGLISAGAWFLFDRLSSIKLGKSDGDAAPTEIFTDPELGDVPVKKVEGAQLNTYNTENLVKNDNGYYEYYSDGKKISKVGIDIAEYQGTVDFAAVKKSGVDFVILRIGGRYYSDKGALYEDGSFDTYYQQATDAGLKVGAYFFSQAITVDEAVEEAEYVVKKLNGRKLQYPVAFDWEIIEDDDARTDNCPGKTITAMAEKFCDTIKEKGYQSMVYASTSLMLQSYDFETMKDYEFWLADYREFPIMYYDFAIWQYNKEGKVNGIDSTVDLNICFKPYS